MFVNELDLSKSEKDKILIDANNMISGLYIFDGIWDMEACGEYVNNKKIKWNISYDNDFEWTYMFTRMDYLYKLIIAYKITNEKKYIKHGFKIINKWYKDNRKYIYKYIGKLNHYIFKNNYSHRSLDVAIMSSNIVDYINYCYNENIINSKIYKKYKNRLFKIINYVISQSNSSFKAFSNWGIIENANVIYCYNQIKNKKDYNEINNILVRQINNQILSDGSQIESSPMYLVQILLVLLKVYGCSKEDLRKRIITPIKSGLNYIIGIRTLDNCIPNIGDSDYTNISELMHVAYKTLNDNYYLNFINKKIDIEYRVKYGKEKTNKNKKNNNKEIIQFNNQVVYRNKTEESYLICLNTPRVVDGHKHYDYLSLIYQEYGEDLLIDLGRFSYKNNEKRKFYVGPAAHNTINIVNNKYYEYITNWVSNQRIDCNETKLETNEDYFTVKMTCVIGYNEIYLKRYVTYIDKLGIIITDIIDDSCNDNNYESFFNIGEHFRISNNKIINKSNDNEIIYYNNDSNDSIEVFDINYSKKYNEELKTKQICLKTNCNKVTHSFFKIKKEIKVNYANNFIEYYIDNKAIKIKE